MPYVKRELRALVNHGIEGLVRQVMRAENPAGLLTYILYKLSKGIIDRFPASYASISSVIMCLDNTKSELYRKILAPYEDRKIEENGDI